MNHQKTIKLMIHLYRKQNKIIMRGVCKIEQYELGEYVLDLYTKGLSTRQISARIKTDKNISIGHCAIHRYLDSVKREARQAAQTVREEHVRRNLPGHLAKLDAIIEDLYAEYTRADLRGKLAVVRELRPTIELVIGRAPEETTNPVALLSDEEVERRAREILARRSNTLRVCD